MKKFFINAAAIIGCTMLSSCGFAGTTNGATTTTDTPQPTQEQTAPSGQDILGKVLNGVAAKAGQGSVLGDIISTFGKGITTSQSSLVGTWNYAKPCVQFESESLLSKAGGSMMSNKVESTLETYYQKVGIKAGACKFVFNKDNTLQYSFGGKTYNGKYAFNADTKQVTITTQHGANVTAYVSIAGSSMGLTFDANKLLTLVQGASTKLSSQNSTIATISKLAGNFNGMKLGFEFTR